MRSAAYPSRRALSQRHRATAGTPLSLMADMVLPRAAGPLVSPGGGSYGGRGYGRSYGGNYGGGPLYDSCDGYAYGPGYPYGGCPGVPLVGRVINGVLGGYGPY